MDVATELVKTLGPAGLIAVILWVMLGRSEDREAKKDLRIQLLENLLTESYDERIEAANQISDAIHSNTTALTALSNEIRFRKDA